ncbi:MAG: hypothetical protein CSA84_00395 [Actinomycetales bacterium]|nr:MAG: hypothetical protein CSA84_00395 [Actinomycetales bacterium]
MSWWRVVSRAVRRGERSDAGQLSVLILGLCLITTLLVIGGIDATAAHLARVRLIDVADGAALDAADALDPSAVYSGKLNRAVALSDATVRDSAGAYLAALPMPSGVTSWRIGSGTGAESADTAVVVVEAQVELPMTGGALAFLDRPITITTHARARAPLSE